MFEIFITQPNRMKFFLKWAPLVLSEHVFAKTRNDTALSLCEQVKRFLKPTVLWYCFDLEEFVIVFAVGTQCQEFSFVKTSERSSPIFCNITLNHLPSSSCWRNMLLKLMSCNGIQKWAITLAFIWGLGSYETTFPWKPLLHVIPWMIHVLSW